MIRFVRQLWRHHRLAAAMLVALMLSAPAFGGLACAAEVVGPGSADVECISGCGSNEIQKDFDACLCGVCHSGHNQAASLPDQAVAPMTLNAGAVTLAWFDQALTSPATVRGLERPPRV